MDDLSYGNLLIVCAVGAIIPLGLALIPRLRLPSVVLEIGAGVVIGPAALGWVRIDVPVQVLSWLGLTFLLFLAGLEIDPARLRGPLVRRAGAGYVLSLVLATPIAVILAAIGWVDNPALLVIVLSATALSLVVPVIRDASGTSNAFGQSVIVAATIADIAAIILLSVLFGAQGGPETRTGLLITFALVVAVLVVGIGVIGRWGRLRTAVTSLQESTAQIRVRLTIVLLVGLTALAAGLGLEAILGAFIAGVVIKLLLRMPDRYPNYQAKIDAVGFGLLIPIFYVTIGLQLDVRSLVADPEALLRVPVFLLALLLVRGLPALLFIPSLGVRKSVAAGLLQATSLPFIIAATQVGMFLDLMSTTTAAALVSAGILSVAIFPAAAFMIVRDRDRDGEPAPTSPR